MMLYPSREEVRELLSEYDLVPVYYEVLSDSCTPIHVFHCLREDGGPCFILESVDNTQWGRYSFIGAKPKLELQIKNGEAVCTEGGKTERQQVGNPVSYLARMLDTRKSPSFPNRPKMTGGLVGYFGYDTVRYMEPKKLCNPPKDDLDLPDCHLFLYDTIVAFDHLSSKTVIIQNIKKGDSLDAQYEACERTAKELAERLISYTPPTEKRESPGAPVIKENLTKAQHLANIEAAKEHIRNGDIFQVVLSRRLEVENPADPFDVYRCLRSANPSPYLYFFEMGGYQIAGASPEMLVNVTKGIVSTKPIAGTAPRGLTQEQDDALEQKMLADPKERAEHTMLVDLARNDVGRVCRFGSVEVTERMRVEKYSKVMHMVSGVKGMLREDKSALDALLSVLPAGTLSGAPKIRAMQIIDELEPNRRGLYGGTVGYLGFDGNIDTCIAIRTVLFRGGHAYVQAGSGIVADSVPEREYEECGEKAAAVIRALEQAAAL